MNNNYNPYTVPDKFFENTRRQTVSKFRNRIRAIRCGLAAMFVAAVLIVTPLFIHTNECKIQESEVASNSLAGMYEYDIFLQVNFEK